MDSAPFVCALVESTGRVVDRKVVRVRAVRRVDFVRRRHVDVRGVWLLLLPARRGVAVLIGIRWPQRGAQNIRSPVAFLRGMAP